MARRSLAIALGIIGAALVAVLLAAGVVIALLADGEETVAIGLDESEEIDSTSTSQTEQTSTTERRTTTTRLTTTTAARGESLDSLLPVGAGSGFLHEEDAAGAGTRFAGFMYGLLEVPKRSFTQDEPGRCVLALGSLTPEQVGGGAAVSSGFDTPSIGLIVDGRLLDFESGCETEALEAAGYRWVLDVEASVGTATKFYDSFLVPEGATIDAIAVGEPTFGEALYYEPTILDSAP